MKQIKVPRSAVKKLETSHGNRRFGRFSDVEALYGLKRTTTYNLLKEGKIRSCALTVTGKRCRARLIDLDSVEEFIRAQMRSQKGVSKR